MRVHFHKSYHFSTKMNTVKETRKRNSSEGIKTTDEKKTRKKSNDIPKNLLLAYTYFLNEQHTCKIVIGFCAETFEAEIIFHRVKETPIYITFKEWENYFNNFKKIEGSTTTTNDDEFLAALIEKIDAKNTTKTLLNFTWDNDNNNNKKLFALFKKEYTQYVNIIEFLNVVMCYNNNAVGNIKKYFTKYLEKCKAKTLFQLSFDDYYIPMEYSHVHCNYSRLFFEIPIFCSSKLFENILKINFNVEM